MATKRELKRIVKMHAAAVLLMTEHIVAFDESDLTEEDFAYMGKEIERIAFKILEDNPLMNNANLIVKTVCGG